MGERALDEREIERDRESARAIDGDPLVEVTHQISEGAASVPSLPSVGSLGGVALSQALVHSSSRPSSAARNVRSTSPAIPGDIPTKVPI